MSRRIFTARCLSSTGLAKHRLCRQFRNRDTHVPVLDIYQLLRGDVFMTRLRQEPQARPQTLEEILSLAAAMESEAVARYGQLAAEMTRRGEHALAATFEAMLEEERDHLAGIEHWSRKVTGTAPERAATSWILPPEIASSWDEVAASALLTPYRALSIAVVNEERGFAFYSYVAARAETDAVRAAAERLAQEELRHAALLRRERRRAFRRERRNAPTMSPRRAHTEPEENAGEMERLAADLHGLIAERLAALGQSEDVAALAAIAEDEGKAAASLGAPARERPTAREPDGRGRLELLRAGLAESERLYDMYADAADRAGAEPMLIAAQQGAGRIVRHLGLIAARLHAPST
jgi:rubrerythrin